LTLRVSLLISVGYDEIRGFGGMEQFLLCPHATFSEKAAAQYRSNLTLKVI
jgi:hypothetical protein